MRTSRGDIGGRLSLLPVLLVLQLAAVAAPAFSAAPAAGGSRTFLWEVRSATTTVHLLGSIHFLKREMYPLDARIEEAFEASDVLAVESDVAGPVQGRIAEFLLRNAFYPEGDDLEKHVTRETYELVLKELPELGPARAGRMKPWALALSATAMEALKMGLDPAWGIDRYFLLKAKGKREVRELERYDEVVARLNGLPEDVQDLLLFYTLDDLARVRREAERILEAWSSGDDGEMARIVAQGLEERPRLAPVHEILVLKRNREMAKRIAEYLRGTKRCFVVVGAAHLVGPEGILELLRKKGFSVGRP